MERYVNKVVLIIMLTVSNVCVSASFDCTNASRKIEKMICISADLSEMDRLMGESYSGLLKWGRFAKADDIRYSQRSWIRDVRDKCIDAQCLASVYRMRLEYFDLLWTSERFVYVTSNDYKEKTGIKIMEDPEIRLASFNDSVRRYDKTDKNMEVISCKALVLASVGTVSGNNSYGGYCYVKSDSKLKTVMICDDDMVGHYKVVDISFDTTSLYELASFTYTNCYGG